MYKETIGNCELYNGVMEDVIPALDRADHILTDPPYLYLKYALDCPWDEPLFFEHAKRLLPDSGFIALFGRGTSFYRWNTSLAELGFVFKEEIVWDKKMPGAPCLAISRVHETVSIHTKKSGVIRRAKVPYVEQKQYDVESIVNDIKRLKSAIGSDIGLNEISVFLKGIRSYTIERKVKFDVTLGKEVKTEPSVVKTCRAIKEGMREKSIIRRVNGGAGIVIKAEFQPYPREAETAKALLYGMREKSVLTVTNTRYNKEHPTEKPVRLGERLIALISDPGDTILDPFMGSGSFGVACVNTGRRFIGVEKNAEYFDIACRRIEAAEKEGADLFTACETAEAQQCELGSLEGVL